MKFVNPLPFVSDIKRAKHFYITVLGLNVLEEHNDFIKFDSGFALHDGMSLHRAIFGESPLDDAPYGRRNIVLYFEVDNIDAAFVRIADQVDLIHPVERQAWGQRVFRFYDLDRHIIEIGQLK
jgi:catechol 2,3-dioxygenase-like lactoylglutathione lyase family enzyme